MLLDAGKLIVPFIDDFLDTNSIVRCILHINLQCLFNGLIVGPRVQCNLTRFPNQAKSHISLFILFIGLHELEQ
jgi:hypothetical protein